MKKYILSLVKRGKNEEARDIILKEFFNYSDQKKAISRAARESADDQKTLIEKYNRVIRMGRETTCNKQGC